MPNESRNERTQAENEVSTLNEAQNERTQAETEGGTPNTVDMKTLLIL
ncbi:MAG: hypothetical protein ABS873_07460 [Alkalibacterium sp.]